MRKPGNRPLFPMRGARYQQASMPILFLIVFVDLVGFGLIIPLLPFYAERFGASPQVVTILLAIFSLMSMISAPLWGRISDRIGRRPVLMASMLAAAFAYLWLGFATELWVLFAARAFAGLCAGNIAAAQAYVADVTPPERRARGMGMIGAAFGLGFIIGPALGGIVAGNELATADMQAPGLIAAGLSFAAFLGGHAGRVDRAALPPVWRRKTDAERIGTDRARPPAAALCQHAAAADRRGDRVVDWYGRDAALVEQPDLAPRRGRGAGRGHGTRAIGRQPVARPGTDHRRRVVRGLRAPQPVPVGCGLGRLRAACQLAAGPPVSHPGHTAQQS